MTTVSEHMEDPELLEAEWDLDPLVDGEGPLGVERMLGEANGRSSGFAETYAGRVNELDADALAEAMHELAVISDLVGRAASFASLRFSTDTADPERGALLARVQEIGTEIETKLLFFDLEWATVDDARAEELLAAPGLEFCR